MFQPTKKTLAAWFAGAVAVGALSFVAETQTNLEVIADLAKKLGDLKAEEQIIWAKADKDAGGRPTAEQLTRLEAIEKEVEQVRELYERRQAAQARADYLEQGTGRKTQPEASRDGDRRANPPSIIDRDDVARHGFQTLGHFAESVIAASTAKSSSDIDGRLRYFADETTFQKSSVGSEGGYLIPPAYMREIYQKLRGPEALLPRTKNMTSDSDVAHMLVNEEQPGITAGAVRAYWTGEGQDIARSKQKLKNKMLELHEVAVLVFASSKSLRNGSLLASLLREEAPKAITHEVNSAIIDGDGVAKPRGILRSPSKVTVAKEAGQAADTVLYRNIVKMWNRLSAEVRANSIWFINQEVEPQLELMEFPTTTGATAVPVYLPPGGAADTPYARLKGRPVMPIKPCKALGDEGDIILTNLETYMTLTAGGIDEDTSMHIAFDQALTAFRFMFSVHGDSLWQTQEQPQNGTTTYSNIVTLADRA